MIAALASFQYTMSKKMAVAAAPLVRIAIHLENIQRLDLGNAIKKNVQTTINWNGGSRKNIQNTT